MSTTTQATFIAPDISCGHCVARVQHAVGAIEGVDQVRADIDSKRVEVTYNDAVTSSTAIREALAEAGYPAAD